MSIQWRSGRWAVLFALVFGFLAAQPLAAQSEIPKEF